MTKPLWMFLLFITLTFSFLSGCASLGKSFQKPGRSDYVDLYDAGLLGISTNPGYGYKANNPIQTGGGAQGVDLYISMIKCTNGAELLYGQESTTRDHDGPLEVYQVACGDSTYTLFFDQYHYSPCMAPSGFGLGFQNGAPETFLSEPEQDVLKKKSKKAISKEKSLGKKTRDGDLN